MLRDSARTTSDSVRSIDRRSLLKVGAWAAPVVVLAAAVPAASASGGGTPVPVGQNTVSVPAGTTPTSTPTGGNKVVVSVGTTIGAPLTITAIMTIKPTADGTWDAPQPNSGVSVNGSSATVVKTVAAAGPADFVFPAYKKKNSNSAYDYTITFLWGGSSGTEFSTSLGGKIL